jgi:hypothetical protein
MCQAPLFQRYPWLLNQVCLNLNALLRQEHLACSRRQVTSLSLTLLVALSHLSIKCTLCVNQCLVDQGFIYCTLCHCILIYFAECARLLICLMVYLLNLFLLDGLLYRSCLNRRKGSSSLVALLFCM